MRILGHYWSAAFDRTARFLRAFNAALTLPPPDKAEHDDLVFRPHDLRGVGRWEELP